MDAPAAAVAPLLDGDTLQRRVDVCAASDPAAGLLWGVCEVLWGGILSWHPITYVERQHLTHTNR